MAAGLASFALSHDVLIAGCYATSSDSVSTNSPPESNVFSSPGVAILTSTSKSLVLPSFSVAVTQAIICGANIVGNDVTEKLTASAIPSVSIVSVP